MKGLGAWLLAGAAGLAGLANGLADTDTITWGGDNSRAGYQTNHNMDPSVVGSNQFGQIFKVMLPGNYGGAAEQIFSQPLVYTPNNSTTQYVYWATTQNNLYKMNAKTGEIVAQRNLHIPFLTADLDGCVDINPNIGITATGVIDPTTETLYLTAKTYLDQTVLNKAQGRPAGRYYVHAIDVNDLSERPNFPLNLENIKATNNNQRIFTGGIHHQRPGLLHLGDYVYAGFASHCVQYEFSGWIIGWHKITGQIVESWATEGANVPITTKGGGVWMSGGGLASDDAGSIFFATGNGYASQLANIPVQGFAPPTSQEESAVHMTVQADGSLKIVDFFMPWEKQALDGADKDLGCSPLELLPPEFGCGDIKRVGVITGKSGKTYWLNMDNLGGYRNGPDNRDAVIQVFQNDNSVYAGAGVYPLDGGYVYINVIQHPSNVFKYSCVNGVLSFPKVATTPETNAYILGVSHGTTTSFNGQPGTGLLWTTDVQGYGLRIYNAVPKDGSMTLIKAFNIPGVNKFTRAVFGNGIVYVGSNQGYVYAYGSPVNAPLNCTSPTDFGNGDIKSNSAAKQITCKANIDVAVTGIELSQTSDFTIVAPPAVPFNVAKGGTFQLSATFSPSNVGLVSADIVVNTTNSVAGYSVNSHARLVGTGQSTSPLLDVSPNTVTFDSVVTGDDPEGVKQQFLINNLGNSKLTIQQVQYSANNASGPGSTWTGTGDLVVGKFTVKNIPTTLDGHNTASVDVIFDSSESGTYSGFLKIISDGGTKSISFAASAGPAAKAVFEFQTIDGTGWVPFVPGQQFTFGNVTENQARPLKFRITNGAASGGVKLSLTVSKPPFGVDGLIKAANQVDLAEGTSLAPGESGTAVVTCSAPKTQWNVAPVNGTALWTINTNDPNLGKQVIQFFCNAVSEQAPPLLSNGQGKYQYKGCFLENNPGRQLQTQLFGDDANTNAKCIAACAAGGYLYCGTQYHRECWAGNFIPRKQVDDINCNFECSGALNQICGGNGNDGAGSYISLFVDTTGQETGPPADPIVNPGASGYTSIGCYTEAKNGRALPNGVGIPKKTVKNCIDACKANTPNPYTYAGLEYGGECWCGNAFGAGSVPAPISDCSMLCNDNATEYCGAGSRLNVYQLGGSSSTSTTSATTSSGSVSGTVTTSTTTTTTSTSTPTPTGPARKPVVSNVWQLQGCWTEATGMRTLSDKTYADGTMTLESCAAFCANYNYFGVEYGQECYCGNQINGDAVKATQEDCSFVCPGDGSEYCGAGNRLEFYKRAMVTSTLPDKQPVDSTSTTSTTTTSTTTSTSTPTPTGPARKPVVSNVWQLQGCWTEATGIRTLSDRTYANNTMTLESCAAFCANYNYFGVEYGRECYCGNQINGNAIKAAQGDCSFKCPGDASEYCGAGNRLEFYKRSVVTPTTLPDKQPVDSTSTTSTTTAAPSTTATTASTPASSTTSSAASSSTTSSAASSSATSSATSSSATSSATSSSATSSSAASTSATSSAATSSTATTSSVTSTTTTTSSTTTTSAKPTSTKPVISEGNANYTYYGCFSEPNKGRALSNQVYNNKTDMSISKCLQKCDDAQKGYNFAGVEYGQECWCGTSLRLDGGAGATTPSQNMSGSDCSFLCPGNKTEYCGAGSRLSLYVLKSYLQKQSQATPVMLKY